MVDFLCFLDGISTKMKIKIVYVIIVFFLILCNLPPQFSASYFKFMFSRLFDLEIYIGIYELLLVSFYFEWLCRSLLKKIKSFILVCGLEKDYMQFRSSLLSRKLKKLIDWIHNHKKLNFYSNFGIDLGHVVSRKLL